MTARARGAPPRISVRRATPSHAPAIRAIAEAAWRVTYRDMLRPETIDWFLDRAYSEERVALRIERHETWVADLADEVAAFAESAIEPDRVTLVAIYADPGRRGLVCHGTNKWLVTHGLNHFRSQDVRYRQS